ncbi:MAG: helix-turn-helix transcriptional regulator [Promethearchaeota archaeon]
MSNRLRKLREEQMQKATQAETWTQEGLARRVGVSRQTIIAIEKGAYNPSLELAFKLARTFGVAIEDIFTYRGEKVEA